MTTIKHPFPVALDNTILNTFRSCPRRAYLEFFEHWKPREPNIHLHAGAAFASGLEQARRAFFELGLGQEESIGRGLKAILDHWNTAPDIQVPADSAKSLERMCQALEYYFSAFGLETDSAKPAVMPSGKRAIEFSFVEALPVPHPDSGEPLLYTGRADMICEMASGLFIEDDKTTSQLGASWSQQWDMRAQFTGYTWAAHSAGINVSGVLVRGVAILKTMFKHDQYITYRSQHEIDRWLIQTERDILRMMESWRTGWWDYNMGDACGSYGGCMFRQICKSPSPDEWLPMQFIRRRWDPLTRTETVLES